MTPSAATPFFEGVRGVAIDTNALGKGRLSLKTLANWTNVLSRVGLEAWVPEPVAWEWAEHAASDFIAAQARFRSGTRSFTEAGLSAPTWAERSADELIADCLLAIEAVHPNLRVLKLDSSDALEALKDQVLLRPPAKRKNGSEKDVGVKTGASDSAAVRLLQAHEPDSSRYVLLTEDDDWRDGYTARSWTVPQVFRNWRALRRELFTVVSIAIEPAVIAFVQDAITSERLDLGPVTAALALPDDQLDYLSSVVTLDVAGTLAVAGVVNPEVARETGEVTATVLLLGDLEATVQRYDENDGSWASELQLHPGSLIRGDVSINVNDDVVLRDAGGEPFRTLTASRYADAEDAFEAVLDAMRCVPGLQHLDWPDAYQWQPEPWVGLLSNGQEISIELDPSPYEEWRFQVYLDGEAIGSVLCEHNADAWVGGSGGFYMEPAWYLSDATWSQHPEWRLTSELIGRALDSARTGSRENRDDS